MEELVCGSERTALGWEAEGEAEWKAECEAVKVRRVSCWRDYWYLNERLPARADGRARLPL